MPLRAPEQFQYGRNRIRDCNSNGENPNGCDQNGRATKISRALPAGGSPGSPSQMSVTRSPAGPDRPDQSALDRARGGCFAPTGIGARHDRHAAAIPASDSYAPNIRGAATRPQRCSNQVIRAGIQFIQIVAPRAAPSETQVPFRFVSHHRIHGAHHLEQHQAGQPAQRVPEHGADETVREIFSSGSRWPHGHRRAHPCSRCRGPPAWRPPRAPPADRPDRGAFHVPAMTQQVAKRQQAINQKHATTPRAAISGRAAIASETPPTHTVHRMTNSAMPPPYPSRPMPRSRFSVRVSDQPMRRTGCARYSGSPSRRSSITPAARK